MHVHKYTTFNSSPRFSVIVESLIYIIAAANMKHTQWGGTAVWGKLNEGQNKQAEFVLHQSYL